MNNANETYLVGLTTNGDPVLLECLGNEIRIRFLNVADAEWVLYTVSHYIHRQPGQAEKVALDQTREMAANFRQWIHKRSDTSDLERINTALGGHGVIWCRGVELQENVFEGFEVR